VAHGADHLNKVGVNATSIIQDDRTLKSSEIAMPPRKNVETK